MALVMTANDWMDIMGFNEQEQETLNIEAHEAELDLQLTEQEGF